MANFSSSPARFEFVLFTLMLTSFDAESDSIVSGLGLQMTVYSPLIPLNLSVSSKIFAKFMISATNL